VLRFQLFDDGKPAKKADLAFAYLFGSDAVPLRAELEFKNGTVLCTKRSAGPAGIALPWNIDGVGDVLLETVRLQERDQPFVLPLELMRGLMMQLCHKIEDWGLFDCLDAEALNVRVNNARDRLIEAMKIDDPAQIAAAASSALAQAAATAEEMTALHAKVLLERRQQTAGFTRRVFGCHVDLDAPIEQLGPLLEGNFDFVTLPFPWRVVEPNEQNFNYKAADAWVDWLAKKRIPIKGTPLVCFQEHNVPDWLYIWEHDFETVRDLVADHVRRILARYGNHIQVWDVISGIHAAQSFSFNFEQLIELTRVAANVARQAAPRCLSIIDIVAPWGEYYAKNQRTIPPMLYAEMALQSGISFDALGLRFCFQPGPEGMYTRDMFQISALLDRFGAFGKPLHITAVQVPSNNVSGAGAWRGKWSPDTQARWLKEFYTIALSKPFVDTVCWRTPADKTKTKSPGLGLFNADLSPKPAFNELMALRREIVPHGGGE